MAKILIPFGTTEGQTARIADYICHVLRAHGHVAETLDLKHGRPGEAQKYVSEFQETTGWRPGWHCSVVRSCIPSTGS